VIEVMKVGDEDLLQIASKVFAYLDEARTRLPESVEISVFNDESLELVARLDAMTGNARSGLALVLLVLALFLRFRLAMWVAAGVPIALAGALMLFPFFGITISTLSVMAFILVLGILVDDAIVVGESIYRHERQAESQIDAAIQGTLDVYVPVFFGVMTTVAAFLPAFAMGGVMGKMMSVLCGTAILCLVLSLLESQLILPAHLAHRRTKRSEPSRHPILERVLDPISSRWTRFQGMFSTALEHFAEVTYRGALARAVEWRYVTLAVAISTLILAGALVASGRARFQFQPSVEGDRMTAKLVLPPGTPVAATEAAVRRLEAAAERLREELDAGKADGAASDVRFVLSMIGGTQGSEAPLMLDVVTGGSHLAEVRVELLPFEQRDRRNRSTREVLARWRQLAGPIPDAIGLTYSAVAFQMGEAINIELTGGDIETLAAAAEALRERLASYPGVFDITDSFRGGKREVRLQLKQEARPLGLTLDDLGSQVRQAFYGEEVQRFQRGRDDVRVMVRYPEQQRASIADLEDMHIRTGDGTEVPFDAVADATYGRGFSTIRRTDRQRVVNVTADVDRAVSTPEVILASVTESMPELLAGFPGVSFGLGGEQRESAIVYSGLKRGVVLCLFLIYALLAIPLRSYSQPLIIMSVIPFGTVGAVVGHMIMGQPMIFFSVLGIMALAGVVVNSSLVLVHFVNQRRAAGQQPLEAVLDAGVTRFRPIFLTSATTFIGLIPLMFESDPAAFMVVPMAISLGYGVVFASVVTLFFVPCLYAILEDVRKLRGSHRESEPRAEMKATA
jgi:multidrug efflux pump subunit AcrB